MPFESHDPPGFGGISIQWPSSQETLFFKRNVLEDLEHIRKTSTGDTLLNMIKHASPDVTSFGGTTDPELRELVFGAGINVVILPAKAQYVQSGYQRFGSDMLPSNNPSHNPSTPFWRRPGGARTGAASTGAASDRTGTVVAVQYTNAVFKMVDDELTPSFIVLAHELIHAYHYLAGHRMSERLDEENRTTGTGQFVGVLEPLVTENRIREEAGLPHRASYS